MPLTCPHCWIALAAGSETCTHCGLPLTPAPTAPDAPPRARQVPWWRPAWAAVGLLLALTMLAIFIVPRGPAHRITRSADVSPTAAGSPSVPAPAVSTPAVSTPAVSTPAVSTPAVSTPADPVASASPVPLSPLVRLPAKITVKKAPKAPRKAVPLSILLTSSSQGHHVRLGEDVTLTALAHGQCMALTLSYRRGLGRQTTHSFTEGGLLSTTWTPAGPGRYGFTATALGGRRQTAVSRPVEIIVDEPAPRRVARGRSAHLLPAEVILPLPPLAVRLPPLRRPVRRSASVTPLPRTMPLPTTSPPLWAKHPTTAPPVMPESVNPAPENGTPGDGPPTPRPAPVTIYHVAAAQFPQSRSAMVLAKSFRLRGSPATTKRMIGYHGKTVYAVVTGAYRRPEEARAAALILQRSGYPAYFFGG